MTYTMLSFYRLVLKFNADLAQVNNDTIDASTANKMFPSISARIYTNNNETNARDIYTTLLYENKKGNIRQDNNEIIVTNSSGITVFEICPDIIKKNGCFVAIFKA